MGKVEKWLDSKLLKLARHGKTECPACGEFNKRGYGCRCKGNLWKEVNMIELPELKSLTGREKVVSVISVGNPSRNIIKLHYKNLGDAIQCYCVFDDEPNDVVDFSDTFTFAIKYFEEK